MAMPILLIPDAQIFKTFYRQQHLEYIRVV